MKPRRLPEFFRVGGLRVPAAVRRALPAGGLLLLAFALLPACTAAGPAEGAGETGSPGGTPEATRSEDPAQGGGDAEDRVQDTTGETAAVSEVDGLTIDAARREVRIPCRFVNPTRILEVFACHRTGPKHETVVEFDAPGPSIYRGLRAIGLRGARYWNGTSPEDFLRNQGDRVVVLVEWEHGGRTHEHAAEGMLLDGSTGFPAFVRGFSVSTRAVLPEEARSVAPPVEPEDGSLGPDPSRVPEAVELTLGATNRRSAVYSLLTHPTNLPRMQPWMLPPELDTEVVQEHATLVEERVPATLIIRPIRSEEEFVTWVRAAASERGIRGLEELYDRALPIAREIDGLKKEYEDLLGEIRRFFGKGPPESLPEEERLARGERALGVLKRGNWLCARIEERYLKLYALEEEFKAGWVREQDDLPFGVREQVEVLVRFGVLYEHRLATLRVELAAVELPGQDLSPGDRNLKRQILQRQVESTELERQAHLADANLRYVQWRIKNLEPPEPYVVRLLEEDRMRHDVAGRRLRAERDLVETQIEELRAIRSGNWDSAKAAILATRGRVQSLIRLAELEEERLKLLEDIRWAENDATSDVPERREGAQKELEEARRKKAELEERIEKLRSELGAEG